MSDGENPNCSSDSVNESEGILLDDYIKAQTDREEEAQAVLGASDANNCTYDQGYEKRQAVYSCATCLSDSPVADTAAGICLACSLQCHDGHDLYELYTKRNFRCDCGNGKFGDSFQCALRPGKAASNPDNKYDHNFTGLYCTCNRPYPDSDHEEDGDMIQCCLCEDWFHDNHLELSTSVPKTYQEMVCLSCIRRHQFLLNYVTYHSPESAPTISIEPDDNGKTPIDAESDGNTQSSPVKPTSNSSDETCATHSDPMCNKLRLKTDLPARTLFMLDGWREGLCRCCPCLEYYKTEQIEFLLDVDDSTCAYESRSTSVGGDMASSSYDKAVNAISSLGRVQQVELVHGYKDMKDNLAEYLQKFAQSGKVVKAEDINEFFDDYKKNKRQKLMVPPSKCT